MLQFRAMQDSDLDTMAQIVERVDMDALCGGKKADGSCLGNIFEDVGLFHRGASGRMGWRSSWISRI